MALAACREDPAGATMYVSLEPCAHTGRTPPCTSGDRRGRHHARGGGLRRPDRQGVRPRASASCATRAWRSSWWTARSAAAARLINQPFRKHARTGRPLVVFKSAMSLDGKVATASGDSQWISGESSRARAHRWRAECDAVAVGIGTARADDPLLTSRVEGAGPPARPRGVRQRGRADHRLPAGAQHRRGAGDPGLLARGQARAPRPAAQRRRGRADHRRAPTRPRAWATRWTSSARAASSRCCSRADRTWPGVFLQAGADRRGADVRGADPDRRARLRAARSRPTASRWWPTRRARWPPTSRPSTRTC